MQRFEGGKKAKPPTLDFTLYQAMIQKIFGLRQVLNLTLEVEPFCVVSLVTSCHYLCKALFY